jgi:hypothetical protein
LRHERVVERRLREGMLDGLGLDVRIIWFPSQTQAPKAPQSTAAPVVAA